MLYQPEKHRTPLERKTTPHRRPDPTRAAIRFDPTKKRMKGVLTVHGNAAFDMPFISEIAPNLWQGGCQNNLVLPEFIDHLVSLYPWETYTIMRDLDSSLSVKMFDSEEQGFERVDTIARWINECRKTGVVLVHCQAGLNRSSLVVARALMLQGMSAVEAIQTLRQKRSSAVLCNKAFEQYLLQL